MTETTYDLMVDIDDVVFPLATGLHRKAHELGLHDNTEEALRVWHGYQQYGCTREQWHEVFEALHDEDYYLAAQPIPGAAEALRRLLLAGHRIHLVTARGFMGQAENIRRWTAEWVEEFAIPHDTLTFSQHKPATQADLGVSFDFAIDDGTHNYRALRAAGVRCFLLTVPHNEDDDVDPLHRVNSVSEWADMVEANAWATDTYTIPYRFMAGVAEEAP